MKQLEANGGSEPLQGRLVIKVFIKRARERDCKSAYYYTFTAWKNIVQNYELINSLEFFCSFLGTIQ